MPTIFENLVGTLLSAACDSIQEGRMDAHVEAACDEFPGLTNDDAIKAGFIVASDCRIYSVECSRGESSFRYEIALLAGAADVNASALKSGMPLGELQISLIHGNGDFSQVNCGVSAQEVGYKPISSLDNAPPWVFN